MPEILDNVKLATLTSMLLADAAFVFAEPSEAFTPQKAALSVARVALLSDESLELLVVAETELARALAANLLGIEEDSDEAEHLAGAALGEWTNMLAGSLAVEHTGANTAVGIGIPELGDASLVAVGAMLAKAIRRASLVTETGQHMVVVLRPLEMA